MDQTMGTSKPLRNGAGSVNRSVDGGLGDDGSSRLAELFTERYQPMVRMAAWLLGDATAAEDVVQDAFARLQAAPVAPEDLDSAAAYLRTTVINLTRTRRKRLTFARTRIPDQPLTTPGPEAFLVDEELVDAIAALPVRQRECVVLRFGEDLTIDQIAEVLGVGSGSIKTHLHRGLRALERRLADRAQQSTPTEKEDR